jgi:hypothetical protein
MTLGDRNHRKLLFRLAGASSRLSSSGRIRLRKNASSDWLYRRTKLLITLTHPLLFETKRREEKKEKKD